jgi:hypothetical protein
MESQRQLELLMLTSEPTVLCVDKPFDFVIMGKAPQALLSFPPRLLGATERELFYEWLSRAGDISLAYVSQRRSDDPRLYRRIVIRVDPDGERAYTVHTTELGTAWLVSSLDQPSDAQAYDTLRDALNSIRPVLD